MYKALECVNSSEKFERIRTLSPELLKCSSEYNNISTNAISHIEKALIELKLYYNYEIVEEGGNILGEIHRVSHKYGLMGVFNEAGRAADELLLTNFIYNNEYRNEYEEMLKVIKKMQKLYDILSYEEYRNIINEYILKIGELDALNSDSLSSYHRLPIAVALKELANKFIDFKYLLMSL